MADGMDSALRQINEELKALLLRHMPAPGKYATSVKGLTLSRRQEINKSDSCFGNPSVAAIVQGGKCAIVGGEEYRYTEGQYCITGIDLPSAFYILHPSEENPFLAVIVDLDCRILSRLVLELPPVAADEKSRGSGFVVGDLDVDLLTCFLRLVRLLDKPEQIPVRAPMIIAELHCLLLASPRGDCLRQLNTSGTQSNMIVQAVSWLKDNYAKPLRVEDLARQANMSLSTFHRYFKEVTGLSPLQFHKQLRLYEAQRLMVLEDQKASSASMQVGYESEAQFHREYKRLFGESPGRDKMQRQKRVQ